MDTAGNRTLREILEYRAAQTPDELFVRFDPIETAPVEFTWAGFDVRVNRTANMLRTLGIGKGDKINLHLANCMDFLFLWFAAAKISAVIMPTNVAASADELEYLVEHSGSRLIFSGAEHAEIASEVKSRCANVERIILCDTADDDPSSFRALVAGEPDTPPDAACDAGDEVAILYTSGTTSRPKGVLVTNANYIYAGETVAKALSLAPRDRHLVVMPLFHGNAQYYSTMSAMVTGASMVLVSRFSASRFFDQAIAHDCTVSSLFSAPMRMVLAQPVNETHTQNKLRAVLFAQCVTPAQLDAWQERFNAPLLQLWGMTETMGPPLMNPLNYARNNMSMGLPVMGYRVQLVDDDGKPVPQGQTGQIIVSGEPGRTLMKGYFRNPEATDEASPEATG